MTNRRQWMRGAAFGALPVSLASQAGAKLTARSVDVFPVKVNQRGNWILVEMSTSEGVTGVGDASHGRDVLTIELLRRFFELLKGRSVFDIEWLRKQAESEIDKHGIPAAVALSALEQCTWDIAGKAFGVPAYQLFGGLIHSRIRNYANINRAAFERSPDEFAGLAAKAAGAGFDAIKLAPWDGMPRNGSPEMVRKHTELGIACLEAVRRAIGPRHDLLVDGHSHFTLEQGLTLAKRLEPMNLFWLEEMTPARPPDNLAAINRAAAMRTAGGESIYGVKGFYPYVRAEAVDIVMPDVKYCGGMLELKKIAALAEAAGLPVSPHGPASPVGNLAAAHVSATMPNFLILEYAFGECGWREEVVDPPEKLNAGYLTLSSRPGLGVTLNKRTIERNRAS